MKIPSLVLSAVFLLLSTQALRAQQTGKFYIGDREVTREELFAVPGSAVESMSNSVEDGVPVLRILLKPDAKVTTDAVPAPKSQPETGAEASRKRVADAMRSVYEQTTLLKEGDAAADFTAAKYSGGKLTLSSLRGKVVLLTFWATWCAPCLRELAPEALPKVILDRFAGNPDFVFLPVAYTDSQARLDKFFASDKQKAYTYLRDFTLTDPDKSVFGRYATQTVPRSFVIGRDGTVVLGSMGAFPGELERIAEAVAAALAE